MHRNKIQKSTRLALSTFILVSFAFWLSSCGSSSTSTSTTKSGIWEKVGDFSGSKISGATSFTIGENAYLFGGFDGTNRSAEIWKYEAVNNNWVQMAQFPGVARSGAVAFAIGGKAYVGTGRDAINTRLKDFWEFDPTTGNGSWKRIKDFGGATEKGRDGCISFSTAGKGFVGAGYNGTNEFNDVWEYKPASDTWEQKRGLSSKRVNAVSFVIDNFVYVLGGSNNGVAVREVEQYDPFADTWTQKLKLEQKDEDGNKIDQPISRDYSSAFSIAGFGYITGGSSVSGSIFGDTWQYNPSTDRWVEYKAFASADARQRDAAIGFSIGNFGYITTGRGGSSLRFDDTWRFDPSRNE
jgi:N-acetylneuraminic acid mutarotase